MPEYLEVVEDISIFGFPVQQKEQSYKVYEGDCVNYG